MVTPSCGGVAILLVLILDLGNAACKSDHLDSLERELGCDDGKRPRHRAAGKNLDSAGVLSDESLSLEGVDINDLTVLEVFADHVEVDLNELAATLNCGVDNLDLSLGLLVGELQRIFARRCQSGNTRSKNG